MSATPTVINHFVYFGDWTGFLYKVDAVTGAVSWKKNVTELVWPGGVGATNKLVTRTAATDAGNGNIIIGTQVQSQGLPGNPNGNQGYVVSLRGLGSGEEGGSAALPCMRGDTYVCVWEGRARSGSMSAPDYATLLLIS